MLTYIIAWVVAGAVFLGLDTLWFARMVPRFYRPIMGEIMRPTPNLTAAAAFYLIYVSGVIFFAVAPDLEHASASKAMLNGAILGFFAYATFDLSNHAIMRAWSTKRSHRRSTNRRRASRPVSRPASRRAVLAEDH